MAAWKGPLETSVTKVTRIDFIGYPETPPPAGTPGNLVQALEDSPPFAPSHWGLNERKMKPFSKREVLANAAPSPGRSSEIYLQRQKVVKYKGDFDFANEPYFEFDFPPPVAARWPDFLRFSDQVASAVKPSFAILHIVRSRPSEWKTQTERLIAWMSSAAFAIPRFFYQFGPMGVGMRTYFGQDVLQLFGRDLLLSSPAQVQELDWGGIRLDLSDDLWNTSDDEVADRWKKVMDHLAPSRALAEPVFDKDHSGVEFKPSPAWQQRLKVMYPDQA